MKTMEAYEFRRVFFEDWWVYHYPWSISPSGYWRWRRAGFFSVTHSEGRFPTLDKCVEDAIKHGMPYKYGTLIHNTKPKRIPAKRLDCY